MRMRFFFNNFNFFKSQEAVSILRLVFSGIYLSIFIKIFLQNFGKRKNIANLWTSSSHCTLMADGVQWLSQSDYSICISKLLFSQNISPF